MKERPTINGNNNNSATCDLLIRRIPVQLIDTNLILISLAYVVINNHGQYNVRTYHSNNSYGMNCLLVSSLYKVYYKQVKFYRCATNCGTLTKYLKIQIYHIIWSVISQVISCVVQHVLYNTIYSIKHVRDNNY